MSDCNCINCVVGMVVYCSKKTKNCLLCDDSWVGTNNEMFVCDRCKRDGLKEYENSSIEWVSLKKIIERDFRPVKVF